MTIQETGDYRTDVKNPIFKDVERRTIKAIRELLGTGWEFVDLRPLNIHGDFGLRKINKPDKLLIYDIKNDQMFAKTKRFAWEMDIETPEGFRTDGWGTANRLDFVIFVSQMPDGLHAWVVDAQKLFDYMNSKWARFDDEQLKKQGIYPFRKENTDGHVAVGYAVPLKQLEEQGLVTKEFPVN